MNFEFLLPYWKVLTLYLIPIGGGIPAGVILAKNYQIAWYYSMLLYFISDVILAIVFEPLMHLAIKYFRHVKSFQHFVAIMKLSLQKTIEMYGNKSGPLALIIVAFGVDPMTGRAVAKAAGHGFITGWMIAITGDMFYFSVIMISTLWLNHLLGDGTTTTFIILALMLAVPIIIRKIRSRKI